MWTIFFKVKRNTKFTVKKAIYILPQNPVIYNPISVPHYLL